MREPAKQMVKAAQLCRMNQALRGVTEKERKCDVVTVCFREFRERKI